MSQLAIKPLGTFVRYFGGKSGNLAKKIAAMLPEHQNYIEAYGGAAGLLLNKKPSKVEVYNDLSQGMVTLYRVIRDQPDELARVLELTPFARGEWQYCQKLYNSPEWFSLSDIEKARVVFVSLEQSFNGQLKNSGWRFGGPNHDSSVAQGFYAKLDKIAQVANRFKNVQIENKPALELLTQWDNSKTLAYLDPTYMPATRSQKTKSKNDYEHEMTNDDHDALLSFCLNSKSMIVLSGYYSEEYDQPLSNAGWTRHDFNCIASSCLVTDGNGRKGRNNETAKRVECVWVNPAARPRTLWNLGED